MIRRPTRSTPFPNTTPFRSPDGTGSITFSAAPGTYTITETNASVNGFVFVSAGCPNQGTSPIVTVTVAAGGSPSCTFTDAKRGQLVVTKNSQCEIGRASCRERA